MLTVKCTNVNHSEMKLATVKYTNKIATVQLCVTQNVI